jgi:hypothetical protein
VTFKIDRPAGCDIYDVGYVIVFWKRRNLENAHAVIVDHQNLVLRKERDRYFKTATLHHNRNRYSQTPLKEINQYLFFDNIHDDLSSRLLVVGTELHYNYLVPVLIARRTDFFEGTKYKQIIL